MADGIDASPRASALGRGCLARTLCCSGGTWQTAWTDSGPPDLACICIVSRALSCTILLVQATLFCHGSFDMVEPMAAEFASKSTGGLDWYYIGATPSDDHSEIGHIVMACAMLGRLRYKRGDGRRRAAEPGRAAAPGRTHRRVGRGRAAAGRRDRLQHPRCAVLCNDVSANPLLVSFSPALMSRA